MKEFAIVIVNYNCSKDTLETIHSLSKHDLKLFDIFVVDNNSKIDDFNYLKDKLDKNIKIFTTDKNLGFAGGNNFALKKLILEEYSYFFLLNPDMIVEDKDFFPIIMEQIRRYNPDIFGPLVRYFPEKNKIYFAGGKVNPFTGLTIMLDKRKDINNYHTIENFECDFITGCAMFIRKKVFFEIGFLPEEYFLYFEESDFCMKAKDKGLKVLFIPKTYIFHKVSSSIKYLSNTYLYYMVRNFRIFGEKYVSLVYKPIFYVYYLFFWTAGYMFLSLKNKNLIGIRYIILGLFNIKL